MHEVKAEQTESEWFKGLGVVRGSLVRLPVSPDCFKVSLDRPLTP